MPIAERGHHEVMTAADLDAKRDDRFAVEGVSDDIGSEVASSLAAGLTLPCLGDGASATIGGAVVIGAMDVASVHGDLPGLGSRAALCHPHIT